MHESSQHNAPTNAGEQYDVVVVSEKNGTMYDMRDMDRIGKTQELNRNFRLISICGFTAVLMCTWEAVFLTASYILPNGGLAGMIWMYVIAVLGFSFAILSMAEMASMAPTSGGQYHWVSEFAPRKAQKFLSFVTGWLCVLGWQTDIASGGYLVGLQIQGLIALNDTTYSPQPWHGTLMIIAVVSVAIIFNTFFAKQLPLVEGLCLILHVCGFFAILITLWVFSPHRSSKAVFTEFTNAYGWPSQGLACLVGITGPIFSLLGPDAAVHMSEEIRDASRVLPPGMVWTLILNGSTGLIMVITFAFCIPDIDMALTPTYNFTYIDVFFNQTNSRAGASIMTAILTLMTLCATISAVATASRQLFAFARDNGLPWASFISRVRPGWDIPLNAVVISWVITCLLSLVNLGSAVAFNAIASLSVGSLLTSYIISISCVAIKRTRGQALPAGRWSLGRYGLVCNVVAVVFLSVFYVFAFFPLEVPVTPVTMNWSIAIYGAVIVFSVLYFWLFARRVYVGPVVHIKRDL